MPTQLLFELPTDISDALAANADCYQSVSTSVLRLSRRGRRPQGGPFRPGFLDGLETRAELNRLLSHLDERARSLLLLWFVHDRPVTVIADMLRISRMHCYRLRDRALQQMLENHHRWVEGG
jgi:DNA-directed RNA polymerase specialized sigma24 family protein